MENSDQTTSSIKSEDNKNTASPSTSMSAYSDKTKADSPVAAPLNNDALHLRKLMKSSQRGSCQLIMGPMFAGKSTELLRRMNRLEISGKKCLSVKFNMDNRYSSDSISTHDK